jgi:frataxin-like iron-binding protein CyaY
VGLNNQLYDLGNILYNYSSNTVQFSAAGTTLAMGSINYDRPTMILETDITATMDGAPMNGDQVLTFGPAVQSKTVIIGSGTNGLANTTNNVIINPLGTGNVPSNTASSLFWDGIKWAGIVNSGGSTYTNAISYDGNYIQYLGQTMLSSGWAWKAYYNGSIYIIIYGGTGTNTGNKIAYSYDGINWTAIAGFVATSLYALAWNGLVWVAGGSGTNTIAYSYDGITWTGLGTIAAATTIFSIIWMGDKWVAFGAAASGILAYTTVANASTGWTTGSISSIFSTQAYTLCWNGQILYGGGTGTNSIAYSYNGITWIANGSTVFTTNGAAQTSWNGKYFLASGNGGNTLAYSQNGINLVGLGSPILAYYVNEFNARRQHTITYQRNLTIAFGSGNNTIAYSLDGINWTGLGKTVFYSSTNPQVAYNGKIWVGVGGGGNTIGFSKNGISWTGLGSSIFSTQGLAIVWNTSLNLWIAGGSGGNTLAYSYDGMTWMSSNNNPFVSTNGCYSIGCSSSLIVAGSITSGNAFAVSTDGINWTGLGNPLNTVYVLGIVWNGSIWVAGGISAPNCIFYSYDGYTWKKSGFTGFSTTCRCIAWNGTMWVAVGQGNNSTAYSYDGINWTLGTNIFGTAGYGVCWNGTMWVAGGIGTNNLAYSYDGINWTGVTGTTIFSTAYGVSSNYQIPPKAFIQHPTLVFGTGGNTIAYSSDGLNWVGLGNLVFSTSGNTGFWNGKMWVGGGTGGNTLAYSYDGFNWTGLGSSLFTSSCLSISCNGNVWVAVGYTSTNGIIAYSYNGINWNIGYSEAYATNYPGSVAWNGRYFLAVLNLTSTSVPNLYNSTNGITWTKLTPTGTFATNAGRGLISNGVLWLMATYTTGAYFTSDPTGINGWNQSTGTGSLNMRGISWNGAIWVAATATGIYYSMNGTTWVSASDSLNSTSVCWNGTRFLLVANTTTDLRYSYNGITWYSQTCNVVNGYIVSNPGVGAFVPPSAMILNNYGISGNGISRSQTLEIVSSDPYYQTGFTNMAVKVECNNVYQ